MNDCKCGECKTPEQAYFCEGLPEPKKMKLYPIDIIIGVAFIFWAIVTLLELARLLFVAFFGI